VGGVSIFNQAARRLYRPAGYLETNVTMLKLVDA
jgi:hypothetical protein